MAIIRLTTVSYFYLLSSGQLSVHFPACIYSCRERGLVVDNISRDTHYSIPLLMPNWDLLRLYVVSDSCSTGSRRVSMLTTYDKAVPSSIYPSELKHLGISLIATKHTQYYMSNDTRSARRVVFFCTCASLPSVEDWTRPWQTTIISAIISFSRDDLQTHISCQCK